MPARLAGLAEVLPQAFRQFSARSSRSSDGSPERTNFHSWPKAALCDQAGVGYSHGERQPMLLPFKEPSYFGVRIDIFDIPRVIATNRRRVSEFIKNVFRDIGVIVCSIPLELNAQSA